MRTLQICALQPVENECSSLFQGIAFDGCFFYFTDPVSQKIYKYDIDFKLTDSITVLRGYTSLCYDKYSNCFWTLSEGEPRNVYKLNCHFREMGRIHINAADCGLREISLTGVACCHPNKLLLTGNFGIGEIAKIEYPKLTLLIRAEGEEKYTSIETMEDGYIYSYDKSQCSTIGMCECEDEEQASYLLPEIYTIHDMTYFMRAKNACTTIYILASKENECQSYIMQCQVCSIDKNSSCACIPCPPSPCKSDCSQGAADILESIALVETAISHILNAEGEKIQKILSVSDSPCEILEVNEVVNKTIVNVTHLEQILCEKLRYAYMLCNEL